MGRRLRLGLCLGSIILIAVSPAAERPMAQSSDERLEKVLADYTGLYSRETLDRWRELFLPTFIVAFTNTDGTITVRNLDEFVARQKGFFDTGHRITEELQNVRIERQGRLATVLADFVLADNSEKRRGKLVLLLIEDSGQFKIHSLMFTYHA